MAERAHLEALVRFINSVEPDQPRKTQSTSSSTLPTELLPNNELLAEYKRLQQLRRELVQANDLSAVGLHEKLAAKLAAEMAAKGFCNNQLNAMPFMEQQLRAAVDGAQEHNDRQSTTLDGTITAFRLAGKTFFPLDNRVGIRFETSYGGRYYECYYIILDTDDDGKTLWIYKHTIPFFVPLVALATAYLNTDLAAFIQEVEDYLHAFVSRREQLKHLQKTCPFDLQQVRTTKAIDYVQFVFPYRSRMVDVKLAYDELKASLPSRAYIVTKSIAASGKRTPPASPARRKRKGASRNASAEARKGESTNTPTLQRLKREERCFYDATLAEAFQSAFPNRESSSA